MSELIRTDTVFGKRANIVGNISADLVLESLGNVYIKSRNSTKTLEEVIKSLVSDDLNTTSSKIQIINGLEEARDLKDGLLVYDKSSQILYLTLDGQLIELINVTSEGMGFVKRSGDTMTGKLSIKVPNGPPLYVNSTELVQNLNANYLQGETAKNFTRRAVNEIITGSWKFQAPTQFGANTLFSQDAVINGSIGSSDFAGGFGGYGWRLEASTNTLTIDNLVVRKLMKVYELVVNRISATNGSLWVSNAGKVYKAEPLLIVSNIAGQSVNLDEIQTAYSEEFTQITGFDKDQKFVIVTDPSTVALTTNDVMDSEGRAMITLGNVYSTASRRTMRLITIKDPEQLYKYAVDENQNNIVKAAVDFTNVYYGKTEEEIAAMQEQTAANNEYNPNNMDMLSNEAFYSQLLFDPDFKFDVTLPIIPKIYNQAFEISEEYRKQSLKEYDANKTSRVAEAKQAINAVGITQFNTKLSSDFLSPNDVIVCTKPYYKYFCNGDFYYIELDNEFLPTLAVGDLLRCQKWTYGGIKYYDAIVCAHLGAYSFIIQLGNSFQDNNSRIYYDNDTLQTKVERNTEMYNTSLTKAADPFGTVEKDDSLVQIGNLWDAQRQNAVYITSTDDGAPYLDVLAGINRPDYSVIYYVPQFNTIKLNATTTNKASDKANIPIPFTGNYYIQNGAHEYEYILVDHVESGYTQTLLLAKGSSLTEGVDLNRRYLSTYPNYYTQLVDADEYYEILLEDGSMMFTEDDNYFVNEEERFGLNSIATKTTKVRLGNLDGIQDSTFPKDRQPYGYGLYGQNVFLVGEFYLNNGRSLADISNDAITFAIAARDASEQGIYQLSRDIDAAKTTLQKNINALDQKVTNDYYTKSALKTAGMTVLDVQIPDGNGGTRSYPSIALWGNHIMIATTQEELNGDSVPTAMFYKGRIRGKFLEIDEAHNTVPIGYLTDNYTYSQYTGSSTIHRYTFYVPTDDPSEPYKKDCKYVREFLKDGYIGFVAIVDINGHIIFKNGAPQFPTLQKITKQLATASEGGLYDKITNVTSTYTLNTEFFEAYYQGTDDDDRHIAFDNYNAEKYGQIPVLWSLEADGSGNLGGRSFVWDTEGNVTMTGTVYASSGKIGGFSLESNKIYNKQTLSLGYNQNYDTYFYLANDTTIPCVFLGNVKKNASNTVTGNSRALLTADTFVMQNYDTSTSITSQLIANPYGLSWTDRGFKLGAQAILASITFIPIWCDNGDDKGDIAYVKCYAADPVFNEIIVMYGFGGTSNPRCGYSAIVFPLLDQQTEKSSYIAKGLKSGKISIQITSIPEVKTSASYTYIKGQISSNSYNPDFRNANSLTVKSNIRSICFNKGLHEYGYAYTNKFESSYHIKTKLVKSGTDSDSYTFYKEPQAESQVNMHYNYIEVTSADDASPNSGGYMLNIISNQFIDDSVTYEDPQSIIDTLSDQKTPEEVHQEYDEHYKDIQMTFENAWYPFLHDLPNSTYDSDLSALSQAINNCIATSQNAATNWEQGNATIQQTLNTLDACALQVKLIYENERARQRWENVYSNAYDEIYTYEQEYGSYSSYRNAKSKFDAFESAIIDARSIGDFTSQSLQTTYGAYLQAFNAFYREYLDQNELIITDPDEPTN